MYLSSEGGMAQRAEAARDAFLQGDVQASIAAHTSLTQEFEQ